MPLSTEQLSYLNQYNFDQNLLKNWQKGVREGWYSQKNNWLQGEVHAPETNAAAK